MKKVIDLIEIKRERENFKKYSEARETARILIENCKGDFAIVFRTEDIKHILNDEVNTDFIVAMSDSKRNNVDREDFFFKHFMNQTVFQL